MAASILLVSRLQTPRFATSVTVTQSGGASGSSETISVGDSSGNDEEAELAGDEARDDSGGVKKGPPSPSLSDVVKANRGPGRAFSVQQLVMAKAGSFVVRLEDDDATRKFADAVGVPTNFRAVAAIQTLPALLRRAQEATWSSQFPPTVEGKSHGCGAVKNDFDSLEKVKNDFGSLKKVIVAVSRDGAGEVLLFKSKANSHDSVVKAKNAKGHLGDFGDGKFWEPMVEEGLKLHLDRGALPKPSTLHRRLSQFANSVAPGGVLSTKGVLAMVGVIQKRSPGANIPSGPVSAKKAKTGGGKGDAALSDVDIQRQAEAIAGRVDLGEPAWFETPGNVFTARRSSSSHSQHTFRAVEVAADLDQAAPMALTLRENAPTLLVNAMRSFGLGMTVFTLGRTRQTYRATDDVMQVIYLHWKRIPWYTISVRWH